MKQIVAQTSMEAKHPSTEIAAAQELNAGFALYDSNIALISWNERFFDLLALPSTLAQVGKSFRNLIDFESARKQMKLSDSERLSADISQHLDQAQPYRTTFDGKEGSQIPIVFVPLYGGGVIAVCVDQESSPLLEGFLDQSVTTSTRPDVLDALDYMADGLALFDSDDRLIFCNQLYRSLHETIADRLLPGAQYEDLLHASFEYGLFDGHNASFEQFREMHAQLNLDRSIEFEARLSDGRWLHCAETKTSDGNTVSIRSDISELKQREAELMNLSNALRSQNLHFDTALNNMAQGLCLFDANNRLIVCNQRYLDMYGFSPEVVKPGIALPDIMQYSVSIGNYTPEDATKALSERPEQAKMREQSVSEQWLRDGRIIAVLHQPMSGGGSVATYEDITARKRAEIALQQHAEALERGNRELQEFAYVASHDLQEPLRKIETFGNRLTDRYNDKLDENGKQYLARMNNAASRMRALIDDLLTYSRVSTNDSQKEDCDLNTIIVDVLSDLEIAVSEKKASILVDELPAIKALPVQMRQLFQNLLSNALKFTRPDVEPKITVKAGTITEENEETPGNVAVFDQILIEDNGIGFDQKHADRIFGIFQRLQGRGTYEGTGIGLATCRKIVERCGGTITAHGKPGEGAMFDIRFPRQQSNSWGV